MSRKEAPRTGLIRAVLAGKLTTEDAASALRLSVRQVRRLVVRYRTSGVSGLLHGNRGRPSKRRLSAKTRRKIVSLMRGLYAGLNDCHLTEKLREVEQIPISRAVVRRLRLEAGIASKRTRRSAKHRRRRERSAAAGALVQIDGSPHRWLGARTAPFTLLGAVDDATGAILELVIRPTEDLHGYVQLLDQLARSHGLPGTFYGDRSGILVRNDPYWSLDEELAGRRRPTQFGQMLEELGIGFIPAHSPQAKGRVENRWGLLQDRLVQELRLLGVKTPASMEKHLPGLIADLNRRFAVEPRQAKPAWRPMPSGFERMLACRYVRQVRNDDTVTVAGRWIQLPARAGGRSRGGRRVELREQFDGTLLALDAGRVIARQSAEGPDFTLVSRTAGDISKRRPRMFTPVPEVAPRPDPPTPRTPRRNPPPTANHPWKKGYARRTAPNR